jgi:hypothetical protein
MELTFIHSSASLMEEVIEMVIGSGIIRSLILMVISFFLRDCHACKIDVTFGLLINYANSIVLKIINPARCLGRKLKL